MWYTSDRRADESDHGLPKCAPTWSWASVQTGVHFTKWSNIHASFADVQAVICQPHQEDVYGQLVRGEVFLRLPVIVPDAESPFLDCCWEKDRTLSSDRRWENEHALSQKYGMRHFNFCPDREGGTPVRLGDNYVFALVDFVDVMLMPANLDRNLSRRRARCDYSLRALVLEPIEGSERTYQWVWMAWWHFDVGGLIGTHSAGRTSFMDEYSFTLRRQILRNVPRRQLPFVVNDNLRKHESDTVHTNTLLDNDPRFLYTRQAGNLNTVVPWMAEGLNRDAVL